MLLFDENLSPRLPKLLAGDFPHSLHVNHAGLAGADDETVWQFARMVGLAVVTNDDDYLVLSNLHGHPPKLVFLRLGEVKGEIVADRLLDSVEDIREFFNDPDRGVLTIA